MGGGRGGGGKKEGLAVGKDTRKTKKELSNLKNDPASWAPLQKRRDIRGEVVIQCEEEGGAGGAGERESKGKETFLVGNRNIHPNYQARE